MKRIPCCLMALLLAMYGCGSDSTGPEMSLRGEWDMVLASGSSLPLSVNESDCPSSESGVDFITVTGGSLNITSETQATIWVAATRTLCNGWVADMSSTVSSTYARTGNTLAVVIGEDEAVLEAELDGDRITLATGSASGLTSFTFERR